jgi:hypothetical protein
MAGWRVFLWCGDDQGWQPFSRLFDNPGEANVEADRLERVHLRKADVIPEATTLEEQLQQSIDQAKDRKR